jgi:hypothetical protein
MISKFAYAAIGSMHAVTFAGCMLAASGWLLRRCNWRHFRAMYTLLAVCAVGIPSA